MMPLNHERSRVSQRWFVDQSHPLLSFWDFLFGPTTAMTQPATANINSTEVEVSGTAALVPPPVPLLGGCPKCQRRVTMRWPVLVSVASCLYKHFTGIQVQAR